MISTLCLMECMREPLAVLWCINSPFVFDGNFNVCVFCFVLEHFIAQEVLDKNILMTQCSKGLMGSVRGNLMSK